MAVVVDLDVLPGLVARVAAELVVIGPNIARVVVVASDECMSFLDDNFAT